MSSVSSILEALATAGKAFDKNEAGSREALIDLGRALVAQLEIPSEFLQRTFWAEPAQSAIIRIAVDTRLFQHLQEAGTAGLTPVSLSSKTGIDVVLLQRLARHPVAMYLLAFEDGTFRATALSNGLAEENYQDSICFCYDTARPSFNGFPAHFKQRGYRSPELVARRQPAEPPALRLVYERLPRGKVELVRHGVLPGRGHDVTAFAAQHAVHPGRIVLQDREPVIAGVLEAANASSSSSSSSQSHPFDAQAHDFFTPQPIQHARAYSLHSILHDWSDADGVRILRNLVPALKRGYSRVLLNEIVVRDGKEGRGPALAATNTDLMMLAHFAVREPTEAEWRGILSEARLRVVKNMFSPAQTSGAASRIILQILLGPLNQLLAWLATTYLIPLPDASLIPGNS
ncbi:O-methyltransferase [Aspergillus ustus]|uniref:O-methyltransferase n=1 Tax=Aspergillus ustus TaxID=40382 RepID=A0A0C1E784_ASPUT|nr:O-methyltransferase [Aspergillus ustus]